ncbi:MAG: plasmid pRiA4b ORF-3 family protein [Gemmatimonadetes bacterium]|nr:plasmid pRiA4b ORF-3 family protein [Gemmatimonadota bacterium]
MPQILQLKVALRRIRPPIWRRLEVSADASLFELHHILQAAMGWTDSHLHLFEQNGVYYGAPDREFGMPMVSERRTRIGELLPAARARLVYEYDFGDSWEHDVVVEAVGRRNPRRDIPV